MSDMIRIQQDPAPPQHYRGLYLSEGYQVRVGHLLPLLHQSHALGVHQPWPQNNLSSDFWSKIKCKKIKK